MGTRSITTVLDDNGNKIIEMYKQYDGYPSGLGKELVDFIKAGVLVNGYGNSSQKEFNGISCFAAQLVEHFKDGVGGVYLHAPTNKTSDKKRYDQVYNAEYYYEIDSKLNVSCWDCYEGIKLDLLSEIEDA